MSNLCRNKNPAPPADKVKLMLPALATFLCHFDVQILSKFTHHFWLMNEKLTEFALILWTADAAWAISYVTDEDGDRIQAVIDAGCVSSLVRLLDHSENAIVVPALRSVGNIVTGSDTQVIFRMPFNISIRFKQSMTIFTIFSIRPL